FSVRVVRVLRGFLLLQQDVARLEVAVDDALGVGVVGRGGDAGGQGGGRGGRPGGAVEALGEAAAGAVLHREVRPAGVLAGLVDGGDGRVLQPGDRLGLGAEAGQVGGGGVAAGEDHLQRDEAVERPLAGEVDDAHAAAADLADQLV